MTMKAKASIYIVTSTVTRGHNRSHAFATVWVAKSVHFQEVPKFDARGRNFKYGKCWKFHKQDVLVYL